MGVCVYNKWAVAHMDEICFCGCVCLEAQGENLERLKEEREDEVVMMVVVMCCTWPVWIEI